MQASPDNALRDASLRPAMLLQAIPTTIPLTFFRTVCNAELVLLSEHIMVIMSNTADWIFWLETSAIGSSEV